MMFDDIEDLTPNARIECLLLAAKHGNVTALHELGMAYLRGSGVDVDEAEAAKWLHKAAEQEGAESQYTLGCMYATGHAVEKNEEKSFYFFQKAAENGHLAAQCELGRRYELGYGIGQSLEEAVAWYRKAAEHGDSSAQFCLSRMYAYGRGVEIDYDTAIEWCSRAVHRAHMGNREAAEFLIKLKRAKARDEGRKNMIAGFIEKAEAGDVGYQILLAECYEKGESVEKDHQTALKWFCKAAHNGSEYARRIVETHSKMVNETTTEVDGHCQKIEDLIENAESGDAESQYLLGAMFANGEGVEKDVALAAWWYKKSADTYKQVADQYKQSLDEFVGD